MNDVDNGESYACVGAGDIWKCLYSPVNFIVNLKLLLNMRPLTGGSSWRASWEGSGILLGGASFSAGGLGTTSGTNPGCGEGRAVSQAGEERNGGYWEGAEAAPDIEEPEPSGAAVSAAEEH